VIDRLARPPSVSCGGRLRPPRAIWKIVWKCIVFFLLWGLLLAPLIVPFSAGLEDPARPVQARLHYDLGAALTILVAAWIMLRFIDHRPFWTLGFAPKHLARDLALGSVLGIAWLASALAIPWVLGALRAQAPGDFSLVALAWAGTSMLFNTVAQEVLARSYVFQTIQSEANSFWAILVTSLLFTAYHAGAFQGAWWPVLNVFGAGLLLGLAYLTTGNLWLPITMHFVWNFLGGPVLGLTVSGQADLGTGSERLILTGPVALTGGRFGFEGGVGTTVATILTLLMLLRLRRGWVRVG
jgi:CAAX protease family protein